MRFVLYLAAAGSLWAQQQQPHYQPGWPCTGKERAFDPVYSKIAEATGGHLFLFDKSEVSGTSTLAIGDMRHKDTLFRASGKLESYRDFEIPVDATVESLFVTASLQCTQAIQLYDPERALPHPEQMGGSDDYFRAGRILVLPTPKAGMWVLRLAGSGAYSVAVQAKSRAGLHVIEVREETGQTKVRLSVQPPAGSPVFWRVDGEGGSRVPLTLEGSGDGLYTGTFATPGEPYRILVENGEGWQRVDPRLLKK